ncbi:MAG: hypothetical protein ACRC2K_00550 [Clostridium sp.]
MSSDRKNLNISLQSGKNNYVNIILDQWEEKKETTSSLVCEHIIFGYLLDNCPTTKKYVDKIRYNLESIENNEEGVSKFNQKYLQALERIFQELERDKNIALTNDNTIDWEVKYNLLCQYIIENHPLVAMEVMKNSI